MSGVPMAASASTSGVALAGFEADSYGSEYLRFSRGDPITWMPHAEEDENWAFGRIRDRTGWVPRTFFGEVAPTTAPGHAESTSSDSAAAAERERQADDDSEERCAQLERQIRVLKAVISEMRTSQHQKPSSKDKELGTYTVLRKNTQERYYLVEATFPGTREKQKLKWYFDTAESEASLT
mmetsp:Transcript_100432/g.139612  ORF Transcript_100432/g.139612 Transcript_100432/m.139612 type:complete len:181 (-) Transcript_100432:7-549(-)